MAERYFVVLGTIEPRKNHLLLLHVWRQLVEEMIIVSLVTVLQFHYIDKKVHYA